MMDSLLIVVVITATFVPGYAFSRWLKWPQWAAIPTGLAIMTCLLLFIAQYSPDTGAAAVSPTSPPISLKAPDDWSEADKQQANQASARLAAVCPGLNRYAADVTLQQMEMLENGIRIVVALADRPTLLPSEFKAMGQRCYFDVEPNGRIEFSKRPCAAVCIDSRTPLESSDTTFSIG